MNHKRVYFIFGKKKKNGCLVSDRQYPKKDRPFIIGQITIPISPPLPLFFFCFPFSSSSFNMSTLPSPSNYKSRHRRKDSFLLVQEIIKQQELEGIKKVRYKEEMIIPSKSKSNHSVKFTTDPPKVFHYIY